MTDDVYSITGSWNYAAWMDLAVCAQRHPDGTPVHDPGLWFPHEHGKTAESIARAAQAQALCRTCPIIERCRARAIANSEPTGIWAAVDRGELSYGRTPPKTHCHKGHAFTPDNTRTSVKGYRTCRTCERDREQVRRAVGA